jgi:signal peptidase I
VSEERAPQPGVTRTVSWRGVATPLLDHLAPADASRATGRVRNLAVLGAALPWLLPRTGATATATDDDVVRASVAFGVAALATHVVRRRWWGPWVASGAAVAAAFVTGPCPRPWAFVLAGIATTLLLASLARRALRIGDSDDVPQSGIAGIAWSFAWVLVVREFALLPIQVPTGSMQPTIYGARPESSGDHLIVDRAPYLCGDPQRWDVAVFDFPLHRPTTFVKRVIGLPGETVEIVDGDIWIDGRIARKPALVQETLWRPVFPQPNPRAKTLKVAEAWEAADRTTGGGWSVEGGGVRCVAPGDGRESALRFTRRLEQGDVRVRFDLALEGPAVGTVRVRSRGHLVELVVPGPAASAPWELRVDGVAARVPATTFVPDALCVADGLAVVLRRGSELARAEVPVVGTRQNGVELACRGAGGSARFGNLRVDQDQRWVPGGGTARWDVPAGQYFVLGDNSERSEDSRAWRVTELDVAGRATPLRLAPTFPGETGAPVANLRTQGGVLAFTDADGVARRVPRADVVRRRDGVPAPFVPRGHFLGRAALIFWPWVPAEGGFRPRLLP